MPIVPKHPRDRLRLFLEKQLHELEKSDSIDSLVRRPLLREAIDGLVALDYGETQPLFAPGAKGGSKDGTKPYTLRKLRMPQPNP